MLLSLSYPNKKSKVAPVESENKKILTLEFASGAIDLVVSLPQSNETFQLKDSCSIV